MEEQNKEFSTIPEEQPREPESRKEILKRWAGLIVCTLILIGCSLLAAEALKRVMTVETVYDKVITVDIQDLYGAWRYAELSHQSDFLSVSPEFTAEQLESTLLDITEKQFFATGGVEWYVKNPQYILHALEEPTGSYDDVRALIGDEVLGYYSILSEGGTVQPYRIYFSLEDYWVCEFSDNNEAGIIILDNIFRIERVD